MEEVLQEAVDAVKVDVAAHDDELSLRVDLNDKIIEMIFCPTIRASIINMHLDFNCSLLCTKCV